MKSNTREQDLAPFKMFLPRTREGSTRGLWVKFAYHISTPLLFSIYCALLHLLCNFVENKWVNLSIKMGGAERSKERVIHIHYKHGIELPATTLLASITIGSDVVFVAVVVLVVAALGLILI